MRVQIKGVASWALTLSCCTLVIGFYYWTVRSAGGFNPPGDEDYYNFLVQGWRSGHLHMSKEPTAAMKALADPYDPALNGPHRLADATYFKGRYYLYFGAAPAALLHYPYALLTGSELGTTTAIFIYCSIGYLAASLLILRIRSAVFTDAAWWLPPLLVLNLGFATHVLALARRPLVWELPISAAYCFSMLGLLFATCGILNRHKIVVFALAGLCFGLAGASRPTFFLTSAALAVAVTFAHRNGEKRTTILNALSAVVPLSLVVSGVLWHNYARFENSFEFGQNYQLTGVYESKMRHFSPTYIAHNFYIYFLHPPKLLPDFPFLATVPVRGGPPGYLGDWNEGTAGVWLTFPVLWLAPLAAIPLFNRARHTLESRAVASMMLVTCAVPLALMLCFFLATPRYMADFCPSLALASSLGILLLQQRVKTQPASVILVATIVVMTATTITAGALLSFDYHDQIFRKTAPSEWNSLRGLVGS